LSTNQDFIVEHIENPLPHNKAEALFWVYTGHDQMTESPLNPKLFFEIRLDSNRYIIPVDSCKNPSLGNALGGGTNNTLEVAICNYEYRIISEYGMVSVIKIGRKESKKEVVRFMLPSSIKAELPYKNQ